MINQKIIINTDGGARGNPGPSSIGGVINIVGHEKSSFSESIGRKTNNQAEYEAVIFALKKVKKMIGSKKSLESELEVKMDSELIVKQLNREYKVKEKEMQSLFMEVWNLSMDFKKVNFVHIRREENSEADLLVNQALDKEESKLRI